MSKAWFVYILVCSDNSFYCGKTTDIRRRTQQHNSGKGAKYTRSRLPCSLVAAWLYESNSAASRAESAFKQLPRPIKEATLLDADWKGGRMVKLDTIL